MSLAETALPTDAASVEAGEQSTTDAAAAQPTEQTAAVEDKPGEEGEQEQPKKAEKTEAEREIARLRRRVDNLTRQKYEIQARVGQPQQPAGQQEPKPSDDEPVTLTRAEIARMVEEQAKQLAPSINEQKAEVERRQGIVKSLAKEWGQEEFDAKASDLDAAFGGLADASGRPKPATDAIFEADNPKAVIEYLTDPENADEAESFASLSAVRAGREITRIEAKLKELAAKAKPQPSNAAKPVTATKGAGVSTKDPSQMTDAEFAQWRREQISKRN